MNREVSMLRKALALAVLSAATLVPQARADIVLSFSPTGLPTNFTVLQGQTVDVPVYLVDRPTPPSSGGIMTNPGLISAGVRLNWTPIAGQTATVTAATVNPGFQIPQNSTFPQIDNTNGFTAVSAGTVGAVVTASGTPPALLIGTFTIRGTLVGNVTTYTTARTNTNPTFAEISSADFIRVETQPYANIFFTGGNQAIPITYTTTVTTVVPEPFGMLLVVAPFAVVLARRTLAKRKQPALSA
jgi:hypothetical protein